jgi:hypothetical protein
MEYSEKKLRDLAARWLKPFRVPKRFRIFTDTSDFYRIDYDDVVILDGHPYLIRNNEREGRFGIDEQQKFWVKKAIDLLDGSRKVMKLVFHERFKARVGPLEFECARSPVKEARVLDLVSSHPNFMHGFSVKDSAGNIVRIIDFVYGKRLPDHVAGLTKNHDEYFRTDFPIILKDFRKAVEAMKFLHEHNEIHGDIRRDHLIIDKSSEELRWIDFDFAYGHHENKYGYDIFGIGNILVYLVGGGDITVQKLKDEHPDIYNRTTEDDLNMIFHNRMVNLRKVFPYIPEPLNFILMHFSRSAELFYDNTAHFLDDLTEAEKAFEKE